MLNIDDAYPKICFEISPQHEFTFYGGDGQVVGTMNFSRTPAFEGSLDESAHLFFNGVANLWHNEISDLRTKLQAAEETGAKATRMMVAAIARKEELEAAIRYHRESLTSGRTVCDQVLWMQIGREPE